MITRKQKALTLELDWGDQFDSPPYGFSKTVFYKEGVKPYFFVTFNIIISRIFLENCI